jgi:RHS repeat-associated protein
MGIYGYFIDNMKNLSHKIRGIFWLAALLLLSPTESVFAQQQQQPTLSASLEEELFRDTGNCYIDGSGVTQCYTDQRFYLNWSRSSAFPIEDPTSQTGYWKTFVWRISDNNGPIIVGSTGDYSGRTWVQTTQGFMSLDDIAAKRNAMKNAHHRVFSYFVNPDGTQVTFSSNPALAAQQLALLDMSFDPQDQDLQPRPHSGASCSGDPVYLHSGQFFYQCNDFSIPGRNLDTEISHTYFSGMSFNGPFGYGWLINYYMRLHWLRNGNVVIVTGDGRKNTYTFSGGNYIPPEGRFETLVKNPDDSWTLTLAQGEQYQFDVDGKLTAIEDRNDNTITLAYDSVKQTHVGRSAFGQDPLSDIILGADYRLTQVTDTTGRTIAFNYNADGLLESIVDGTRQVSMTYDSDTNDLLTVTKPATAQFSSGVTKTFEYEDHNVKRIKDAKNQYFVENFYDDQGRVEEQNLGGSSMFFDYSVASQVTETDRKGYLTTYAFNAVGNMVTKTELPKNNDGIRDGAEPASYVTTYTYDSNSLKTSETFPRGNGIKYVYDSANPDFRAQGNLLQIRRKADMAVADNDTNDIVTNMTYETMFNQVKTITDPKGNVTTFTYDHELAPADPKYAEQGNVIFIDFPTVAAGVPTTEFAYNAFGQVTEIKNPNGNITQYSYFPTTGYLQSIAEDPAGINAVTQLTYDGFGNLNVVTDANNHATDYDYDELGWLRQVTNPLGFVTKYTHDANGNVIKIERQADDPVTVWQTTQLTYDILNNLKTVTDPLSRVTTYNYDTNENVASIVDAEENVTAYVYDERDLLFTVTDANSPAGVTRYDYDLNGNLAKITDANGNPTTYTYDDFDRLDKTTYTDTKFSEFVYDKNSNLVKHTTPSTAVIDYIYDELDRLTDKNFPANTSLNTNYVYDLGSRLTDADNAASQISFTYDALNRVLTSAQTLNSTTRTVTYDYDKVGNKIEVVYPSSKDIDYTYDANDRIDLVKLNSSNFVDYDHDLLDRRAQKSFLSSALPIATYSYDIANQLSSVANALVNTTAISQYSYTTYDDVGNRTQMTTTGTPGSQTINYAYNTIYELTGVTGDQSNSYAYDNAGNRTTADSVSYTANALNQYTAVDLDNYDYDDNGNLTDDDTNLYTYDEQNRLKTFTDGSDSASYTYDAFNRRVSKTVNSVTTYFLYDGDEIIAEYASNGTLLAEYIIGDQIDEVLSMERNSNTYFYHYDGLGSVAEITNSAGSVSENYTYDAFGMPSVTTSSIGNPYRFTGREFDEESGIYHYRARAYSPMIGRFLQRDPIDSVNDLNINGGSYSLSKFYVKPYNELNTYLYAGNNPIIRTDPFGLWYIDINISFVSPWFIGGTAGVMINNKGIWKYGGGAAGLPGPGASFTFSEQNPSTGFNSAVQGGAIVGIQKGVDSKGKLFLEKGFFTPTSGTSTFFVEEPWLWPWAKKEENKENCN